jgi:hypothetical protein
MSKFTTCYKFLQALLSINIDNAPGYDDFLHLYFELSVLGVNKGETSSTFIDPRKSQNLIGEFEHLLEAGEFKSIVKEFKR